MKQVNVGGIEPRDVCDYCDFPKDWCITCDAPDFGDTDCPGNCEDVTP